MDADRLYDRYRELQSYLNWDAADAARVQAATPCLEPHLPALIDDFYREIERHPDACRVITGGEAQIARLKKSLTEWLRGLLRGPYDREFVLWRRRVGQRHVEIGLDQIYTNAALSRLRLGLVGALGNEWKEGQAALVGTIQSLNKLLDLDLAKIEDAYQAAHLAQRRRDERLAAIGQISGGIAHELRNPLNVIKTSAYYLLNARSASPEKVNEHLQRISQHVNVADSAITALSNFAKMPLPTLMPFSLVACIQEVLKVERLPETIRADVDLSPSLPQALGDEGQIRIVLANLVRNARDAMATGGVLTLIGRESEGSLLVHIADTGVGISPENLHRIMEPLYSTKARGLGLGLALAKAIVDRHQGSMRVESELGRGTTFTLELLAESIGKK